MKMIFFIFLIIFFFIFFYFKLNRYFTYENVLPIKEFILKLSILGPAFIILLFIIFNLAVLPTFYFVFLSGYLYGFIYGFIIGWFGMILGLASSFFNSRYIFRKDFTAKFGSKKIVKDLEKYTEKYHIKAVIFLRIFFIIPYNLQNITYGLTKIKAFSYIIGSAIGILPSTVLYIWLGYLFANNKLYLNDIKNVYLSMMIFAIILALFIFIRMLVKKRLKSEN